jgi:Tol biopolymer transport system component
VIPGICDPSASDIALAQSASQLVVVFTSLRSRQTQGYDLFEARRSSISVSFETPTLIAEVNSPEDDFDPYLSPDGTLLLFHSMRSGNEDIYWTRRDTLESAFGAPRPLSEINSTASDVAPDMAADGSAIWFASARDGDEQIYQATVTQK